MPVLNLIILFIFICKVQIQGRICEFSPISKSEFYTESEVIYRSKKTINSLHKINPYPEYNGPMRIHFHYTQKFTKSKNFKFTIENYINPIKDFFERMLRVKRSKDRFSIIVPRACEGDSYTFVKNVKVCTKSCKEFTYCNEVIVPDKFLQRCLYFYSKNEFKIQGINGTGEPSKDLIMIVDVSNIVKNMKARTCYHDEYDRPILGSIVIPVDSIKTFVSPLRIMPLFKHEMVHALGFDISKYAFFRNVNGDPIVERNSKGEPYIFDIIFRWNGHIARNFTRQRIYINGKFEKLIFTSFVMEKTVKEAQKHFNCKSLNGVDFEDYDSYFLKANHFDELIYGTELMTSVTDYDLDSFSRLTLAFLEDTGWYFPNYDRADAYTYAKDSGCILPFKGPLSYFQSTSYNQIEPFCNIVYRFGPALRCQGRDFFYNCGLYNSTTSKKIVYFKELPGILAKDINLYSGDRPEAEFCPQHILHYVDGYQSSTCFDSFNNYRQSYNDLMIPSYYGFDSECFENTIFNAPRVSFYGAACHKIKLINESHFYVYLQDVEYLCEYGKILSLNYGILQMNIHCGTLVVGSRITRKCARDIHWYEFIKIHILTIFYFYFNN